MDDFNFTPIVKEEIINMLFVIKVINRISPKILFWLYAHSSVFRTYYWSARTDDIHMKWGYRNEDEKIAFLYQKTIPQRVLDIGCGTGAIIQSLLKYMNADDIYAQDISPKSIDIVRSKYKLKNVYNCECVDIQPFPNVDLIISNRVLSALPPKNIYNTLCIFTKHARYLYINEMTFDDNVQQSFYWYAHDYDGILQQLGFIPVYSGMGWKLYEKQDTTTFC